MSWLSSTLGGVASDFVSGGISNYWNSKASATAYERDVNSYQHRYQWAVDDMKQAGLNPILAATNGISGNVNGAVALGSDTASTGSSISGLSNSATARRAQEKNAQLVDSQIKNTSANTALVRSQTESQDWKNQLFQKTFDTQVQRATMEVNYLRAQGQYQAAAAKEKEVYVNSVLPAMAVKLMAEAVSSNSAAGYHRAMTQLTKINTLIAKEEKDMKARQNKADKYIPNQGSLYNMIGSLLGRGAGAAFGIDYNGDSKYGMD